MENNKELEREELKKVEEIANSLLLPTNCKIGIGESVKTDYNLTYQIELIDGETNIKIKDRISDRLLRFDDSKYLERIAWCIVFDFFGNDIRSWNEIGKALIENGRKLLP